MIDRNKTNCLNHISVLNHYFSNGNHVLISTFWKKNFDKSNHTILFGIVLKNSIKLTNKFSYAFELFASTISEFIKNFTALHFQGTFLFVQYIFQLGQLFLLTRFMKFEGLYFYMPIKWFFKFSELSKGYEFLKKNKSTFFGFTSHLFMYDHAFMAI